MYKKSDKIPILVENKVRLFIRDMDTKKSNEGKIIKKYESAIENPFATVLAAHEGIPATAYGDVARLYGFKERIAQLLDVSVKTLKRYQEQNKTLNAINSEMLLKLVAIFKKGMEVFGEKQALIRWLDKPAFGLGNNTPFNLMKTSDGMDLIMEELTRIEYGDLA